MKALILAMFLYTPIQAGLNYEDFSLTSEDARIADLALNESSDIGHYFLHPDTVPLIKYTALSETEMLGEINIAKKLAKAGGIAWCPGAALEIIGFILLGTDNSKSGMAFLLTGMGVNLLTPIPSCIGEYRIKKIDYQGIYKMISLPSYVCSCTLLSLALIIAALSPSPEGADIEEAPALSCTISFYFLTTISEILRGVAATIPNLLIHRFEQKRKTIFGIVPKTNTNGDIGLSFFIEY